MTSSRVGRIAAHIDALSPRERIMFAMTVVLLLWAGWQMLLMSPLLERRKQLVEQMEASRDSLASLSATIQSLAAAQSRDPLAQDRLRLEALRLNRGQMDARVAEATSSLIDPRKMGTVLEAILARQARLELRALSSLPPTPVELGDGNDDPTIWRHGLRLEVAGDYADLLRFVQALEELEWNFVWSELDMTTEADGKNRMQLTLHTLSLEDGWLGV